MFYLAHKSQTRPADDAARVVADRAAISLLLNSKLSSLAESHPTLIVIGVLFYGGGRPKSPRDE